MLTALDGVFKTATREVHCSRHCALSTLLSAHCSRHAALSALLSAHCSQRTALGTLLSALWSRHTTALSTLISTHCSQRTALSTLLLTPRALSADLMDRVQELLPYAARSLEVAVHVYESNSTKRRLFGMYALLAAARALGSCICCAALVWWQLCRLCCCLLPTDALVLCQTLVC